MHVLLPPKDPYFWVQSMKRNPYQTHFDHSDISKPFTYQALPCNGIAGYWNAQMADYAFRFPAGNTVVFQSRDLLFRFSEVVAELRRWLAVRPGADFSEASRLRNVAKKEDDRSRNLEEAVAFYRKPANRARGLSDAELRYMGEALDADMMARWGYRTLELQQEARARCEERGGKCD